MVDWPSRYTPHKSKPGLSYILFGSNSVVVICCRIRRRTAGANQFGATGGESSATPDKQRLPCISNPAWPARQFLFFCMLAPDSIHEFIEAPANLGGERNFC